MKLPTVKRPAPSESAPPSTLSLTATATIDVEAAGDGSPAPLPRFRMLAYTGGPMRVSGWRYPVILDLAAQTVTVHGSNVDLTSYEYKVLEYLMMHAGELVSKADLTEHIYQQDFDRDSNVLEVFIGRLRRKLDPDGSLKPIETVRGRGYRFAIPRNNEG